MWLFVQIFAVILGFFTLTVIGGPFIAKRENMRLVQVILFCFLLLLAVLPLVLLADLAQPQPTPTTIQFTGEGFEPENTKAEAVRFVNKMNRVLQLCLANRWRCDGKKSGWCQPSYTASGWVNDWLPSLFFQCTPLKEVEISAHQERVLHFVHSDQAYEIVAQGYPAMELILLNP